jgi:hypothetical protein
VNRRAVYDEASQNCGDEDARASSVHRNDSSRRLGPRHRYAPGER